MMDRLKNNSSKNGFPRNSNFDPHASDNKANLFDFLIESHSSTIELCANSENTTTHSPGPSTKKASNHRLETVRVEFVPNDEFKMRAQGIC